jgi:transposase-like protein
MVNMKIRCPVCKSAKVKKNGHIPNGKQNHYCKKCGRQFVENSKQKLISSEEKEYIRKLLLERVSLLGICRVMSVSLRWLLSFIVSEYEQLPDDLNYHVSFETDKLLIWSIESDVEFCWHQEKQAVDLDSYGCQEQTGHILLCGRSFPTECQKIMGIHTQKLQR